MATTALLLKDTGAPEIIKHENSKHITSWKHSSGLWTIEFDTYIFVERAKANMVRFSQALRVSLTSVLRWETVLEETKHS